MVGVQDPGSLSAAVPFYADIGGRTIRDVVRPTLTGSAVRIRLSNRFGTRPLTFTDVRIAPSAGGGATRGLGRRIAFHGRTRVTIPVGGQVASDLVPLHVQAGRDLAVSLYAPGPTGTVTGGGSLFHTNYISDQGDTAASASASSFPTVSHTWYFLTGVDVRPRAKAAAVVAVGASITFGYRSTADAYRGWGDILARRLHARSRTRNLSVINAGIAGNNLHEDTGCYGDSVLHRLDRDALDQPGVRVVIIAVGSNDLTQPHQDPADPCIAHTPISARGMIADYTKAIRRTHARQLKAILATIPPFGAYQYWSPQIEQERQAINRWIRRSKLPDAVIDEDAVLADPAHPSRLLPRYDSGDGLHPNDAGHARLGSSINLSMFPTP
jgi:lysophospholipase L1-like esterase